jgi:Sigma-70 region 2
LRVSCPFWHVTGLGSVLRVIFEVFEGLLDDGSAQANADRHRVAKEVPVDDPLERFAGIYDQYYRNVLRYSLQHAEQGTAEDVASETFLIAWRRLPAIPDPPLPWLLGVARNLLRKQVGAGLRRRELVARIAALSSAADGFTVDAGDFVVERAAASAGWRGGCRQRGSGGGCDHNRARR